MAFIRSNQAMFDMINATIDQIFIAIMRGNETCASSRNDMDFLVSLRESFYHDNAKKFELIKTSEQITRIFAKYSANSKKIAV